MSTNVFSGARTIFRVNDKQVAFASGCDGSEEIMYEAVDVLDNVEVAEYVPVGYRVSFNCAVFRTVAGTVATGPISTNGPRRPREGELGSLKNPTIGLFPRSTGSPSEILTNGSMSASISDRLNPATPLYNIQEVKAQSLNFSITARGIVGQNVAFNAIRIVSEDAA
jgi:hypothetical protein